MIPIGSSARGSAAAVALAAAILCLVALAIWWPGISSEDTIEQYRQVLSGHYEDWHPPAMARLWALLHPLGGGTAPMFVLQVALYWLGLGLIAAALARSGKGRAGAVVLAIGALPLFAGWQASVMKDEQMLGAMLAAVGLVGWWRLDGRRIPPAATGWVAVLLVYAALVRFNAVFAVVPLAVMLMPRPAAPAWRFGVIVAGVAAVIAVSPLISHRLFGAEETDVGNAVPIYDLAGIAHLSKTPDDAVLPPADRALIAARHCYQPFFWDPFMEQGHCSAVLDRFDAMAPGEAHRIWLRGIAAHPLAYAAHRLVHFNATERLIVPAGWQEGEPHDASAENDVGLGSPGPGAPPIAVMGGWIAETPLGWPAAWVVLGICGLAVARTRPASPARSLALALAVSALALEASFVVVSIASDLRYHLWPMMAVAVMTVLLLAEARPSRQAMAWGGAALLAVAALGAAARITLPPPPADHDAMLRWPQGDI